MPWLGEFLRLTDSDCSSEEGFSSFGRLRQLGFIVSSSLAFALRSLIEIVGSVQVDCTCLGSFKVLCLLPSLIDNHSKCRVVFPCS